MYLTEIKNKTKINYPNTQRLLQLLYIPENIKCIARWKLSDVLLRNMTCIQFNRKSQSFNVSRDGKILIHSRSKKKTPQKPTLLSPRSHPRNLVGKRTAQQDATKDITSDSQLNSYFPYRWLPASLTVNIYLYLFVYLYITRITINNGTPHLRSLKS